MFNNKCIRREKQIGEQALFLAFLRWLQSIKSFHFLACKHSDIISFSKVFDFSVIKE